MDYKHTFLKNINMHLIEVDYEFFNMTNSKYLKEDVLRKIPAVETGELTFVLTTHGDIMYYANADGTIGAESIDMDGLDSIIWDTYTYGTVHEKEQKEEDNKKEEEGDAS